MVCHHSSGYDAQSVTSDKREECQAQVKSFPGAQYRKFKDLEQAKEFINCELLDEKRGKSLEKRDILESSSRVPISTSSPASSLEKVGKSTPLTFEENEDPEWDVIYTDGACPSNGRGGAMAGLGVWFAPGDPR
jgi:viroplasmin and RNaseH domain-containing protein